MQTDSNPAVPSEADAVVIGAGFGGLGAALGLGATGRRVLLVEALRYPGGCASTFEKAGARYEAGATLFAGLDDGALFPRLLGARGLSVPWERPATPIRLLAPGLDLPVSADKARFMDLLCARHPDAAAGIRRFFAWQGAVADALWPALADAGRLPPFDADGLRFHLARLPRLAALARWVGRPAGAALRAAGVHGLAPLRLWADCICQISVQCGVDEAEGPFGLSTMDYPFRGVGHPVGGIGALADALVAAVRHDGGEVRFATRAQALTRAPDGRWAVTLRGGHTVRAPLVFANVLPQGLHALRGPDAPAARLRPWADAVAAGWGAAMLYLQVDADAPLPAEGHHVEIVDDPAAPLHSGNHLFVSVSPAAERRAPGGRRTVTVSTHLPAGLGQGPDAAAAIGAVHARMDAALARHLPALNGAIAHHLTASPRTWERFTRRADGRVGGIPRRAGLRAYDGLRAAPVEPGLWLVGDSAFPGQSTLAAALGGLRAARAATGGSAWWAR